MLLADPKAGKRPALSDLPQGGRWAIDASRTVGWAYGPAWMTLPALTGQWELPLIGGRGAKGAAFENKLIEFFERWQPSVVVLERCLPLPAMNNWSVAYQQFGMGWQVNLEAYRNSCAVIEVDAPSVRQAVLGTARFAKDRVKQEVVGYCRRRGIKVAGHHAADAALCWMWHGMTQRGERGVAGPLFQEVA